MAAVKKKKKPSRRVLLRRRRRERWIASRCNPEHRAFRIWVHDLDTILHELLRNPAIVTMSNDEVLARAIEFADLYRQKQEERRPDDMDPEDAL